MDNEEILKELRTIRKWSRVQGLQALKEVLSGFSDRDLVIYDAADGDTFLGDIGDQVGRDSTTLSHKFNEWAEMGIVDKDGQQWKHAAPLSSMGIEVPELDDE